MSTSRTIPADLGTAVPASRYSLSDAPNVDPKWKGLCRTGSGAALFGAAIIPIQFIVFMAWPPPSTAAGWFALFQNNKLGGLLAFEFLFALNAVVGIATILALYAALRRVSESAMAIAVALGVVEAICFILARPALEMLFLSEQYAAATTEPQKALYLAAGEAMWATFHGTAFHVAYNIFSIYYLIVPIVMLRSNAFGKVTAYMGIATAVLNWGLYVPVIGLYLSMLSVLPLALWSILVARRLFQLGRDPRGEA